MKFFKGFFRFKNDNQILEQTTGSKDKVVGGKTDFEVKASKKGKNNLRLDYTKNITEPYWQGSNYENEWKPWVNDALKDKETRDKIVKYLDEYKGQDNQTVKEILKREREAEAKGKGSLNYAIKKLATDGKIGPFHTIIKQAISKVTGKDIDKLDIKPAPELKPTQIKQPEPKLDPVKIDPVKDVEFKPDEDPKEEPKPEPEKPKEEPKPEPEKPKEEPKPEPEKPKEEEEETAFTRKPKAETSDPATGLVGEKEKQELAYKSEGGNAVDKLFTLDYPLTPGPSSKLGNYFFRGDNGADFKVGESFELAAVTSKKLLDVDKWVYFLSNHEGTTNFPVELFKFKMKKGEEERQFTISPKTSGKLIIKMIMSTKNIEASTTTKVIDGFEYNLMSNNQAQKFLYDLVNSREPYSKTQWGGPIFSIVTREFNVRE